MIEAVENHNPEVIIIDEIGREREAAAAPINERGVQLIGTAHGRTLENLCSTRPSGIWSVASRVLRFLTMKHADAVRKNSVGTACAGDV